MNDPNSTPPTVRLKPHYVFATVTFAALLGLLATRHPRGAHYLAEAVVTINSDDSDAAEHATDREEPLVHELLSTQMLTAAVRALSAETIERGGLSTLTAEQQAQVISGDLTAVVENKNGSEEVRVRFAAKSKPLALAVVNAVADSAQLNFSGLGEHSTNHQVEAANQDIERARQRVVQLQEERRQFLATGTSAPVKQIADDLATPPYDEPSPADLSQQDSPADAPPPAPGFALPSTGAWETSAEGEPASPATAPEAPDAPFVVESGPTTKTETVAGPMNSAFVAPNQPTPHATGEGLAADPPADGNAKDGDLPKVLELNPRWVAISEALADAQVELTRMLEKFTPQHPLAAELGSEVHSLEQALEATPQYINADGAGETATQSDPPQASFTPLPPEEDSEPLDRELFDDGHSPAEPAERWMPSAPPPELRSEPPSVPSANSEQDARRALVSSPEYVKLNAEIEQARIALAEAIERKNSLTTVAKHESALVTSRARLIERRSASVTPFDLLTLLLPAAVLGMVAALARRPAEPPAVLHNVSDVKKSLGMKVLGTLSTKNGPGIPVMREGGPPKFVRWIVLAAETLCVAAAVLILISFFQVPGFTRHFLSNPFSAFVTSWDFVMEFIRHGA